VSKILLAGTDDRLLETRAAVLKKTGAVVVSCTGDEVLKVVESEMPDLLVLCHSLAVSEAESMADLVRRCCPKAKILLMFSVVGPDESYRSSKFDATSWPEPTLLIKRATELLRILPLPLDEMPRNGQQAAVR
jgi:hypothetical protein